MYPEHQKLEMPVPRRPYVVNVFDKNSVGTVVAYSNNVVLIYKEHHRWNQVQDGPGNANVESRKSPMEHRRVHTRTIVVVYTKSINSQMRSQCQHTRLELKKRSRVHDCTHAKQIALEVYLIRSCYIKALLSSRRSCHFAQSIRLSVCFNY